MPGADLSKGLAHRPLRRAAIVVIRLMVDKKSMNGRQAKSSSVRKPEVMLPAVSNFTTRNVPDLWTGSARKFDTIPPMSLKNPARPRRKGPPPGDTGQESLYLRFLSEKQVPVTVKLRDGEAVYGWIEYFDDRMIRLTREGKPNLFIYKHQIRTITESFRNIEARRRERNRARNGAAQDGAAHDPADGPQTRAPLTLFQPSSDSESPHSSTSNPHFDKGVIDGTGPVNSRSEPADA